MVETLAPPPAPSLFPVNQFAVDAGLRAIDALGLTKTPETPQRGVLGQIAAGLVRGPVTGLANIPRALSAIPPLRPVFEPIAEGIESFAPAPSGGAIEAGVESTTAFLTDMLLFKGGAGVVARYAPRIGAALASRTGISSQIIGTFGGAEFSQSRQELEQINERLPEGQKIPTDEITRSALISAVAEAGPEILSTPFVVTNLLRLSGVQPGRAVVNTIKELFANPQSGLAKTAARVARVAAPAAEIAATEVPTELATAGIQAAERQRVLEGTGIETPGALEAMRQSVGPTLVSSALLAGAGRIGRRPAPAAPPPPVVPQPLEVPAGAPTPPAPLPEEAVEEEIARAGVAARRPSEGELEEVVARAGVEALGLRPPPPAVAALSPEQQRFAPTLMPGLAPQLTPTEIGRVIEPEMPGAAQAGITRRGLPGLPPQPEVRQELTGVPLIEPGIPPSTEAGIITPPVIEARAGAATPQGRPAGQIPSALEAGLTRRGMAAPEASPELQTLRASAQNLAQALGAPVPQSMPQVESFVADLPLTVRRAAAEDAALAYVSAQEAGGFAGLNFDATRNALQRLYNLPSEAEATRILTAAVSAARARVTPVTPPTVPTPAPPGQTPVTPPVAAPPGQPPPPAGEQPAVTPPPEPPAPPTPGTLPPEPGGEGGLPVTPTPPTPPATPVTPSTPGVAPAGQPPPPEGTQPAVTPTPAAAAAPAAAPPAAAPTPPEPAAQQRARPGRPVAAGAQPEPPPVAEAAPDTPPAGEGLVQRVVTQVGTEIETIFDIVEADDLVTSHDLAFNVNPRFPAEAQPRDRTRVASEIQVNTILNTMDNERLAENRLASDGAPITDENLVVEAGNARSLAILLGYQQNHPNIVSYKQFLQDNAERFGRSQEYAASRQSPVLIRKRLTALTPAQRIAFVNEANIPSGQQMSDVERARVHAALLTPDLLALFNPSQDGNIAAASNRAFVQEFMAPLSDNEQSEMLTRDGQLNQTGVTRIRNALFYALYGNMDVLERLAEDTDSNIKNITNALVLASRDIARLRRGLATGALHPINPLPDLMAAVSKFSALRDQGETVENYLNQGGLFGEELSPLATDMLRFLDANKRSARRMTETLQRMVQAIEDVGDPRQGTFLGMPVEVPTAAEVFEAAINATEEVDGAQIPLTTGTVRQPGTPGGGRAAGRAPAAAPSEPGTPATGTPAQAAPGAAGPGAAAAGTAAGDVESTRLAQAAAIRSEFPDRQLETLELLDLAAQISQRLGVTPGEARQLINELERQREAGLQADALTARLAARYGLSVEEFLKQSGRAAPGGQPGEGPAQIEEPEQISFPFFPPGTTPGGERPDASPATRQANQQTLGTLVLSQGGENANAPASAGRGVLSRERSVIRVVHKGRGVVELTRTIPENEMIEELRTTGTAAFVGRTVRGRDDIAVYGQTIRDPRIEHFSVVGLDASGQAIFYEGVSSRLSASSQPFVMTAGERRALRRLDRAIQRAELAGSTLRAESLKMQRNNRYLEAQERGIRDIGQRLQAAGATAYYLVHNHPSTNLVVSRGDQFVTARFASLIPGFQGHVVLDSGAYSFIGQGGQLEENIPLPERAIQPVDPFHVPANPNVLSAEPVRGTDDIVRLGMMVNRDDAMVAFFLTTLPGQRGAFKVRGVLLMPNSVWNKAGIAAYLRRRQAEYGAQNIVTFSNSQDFGAHGVAQRLFEEGVLAEHVAVFKALETDAIISLQEETAGRRTRPHQVISLGVGVQEEPQEFRVFKTIPTTLEGVRVEHANKAVLEYAMMAHMAETSGMTAQLSDAAFRKLKITFTQLDEIGSKTLLRWMTDTDPETGEAVRPGQFQRFVRGILSGEFNPSSSSMAALAKLEQAMLHDLALKQSTGALTEEQFQEAKGKIMQFSMTLPGTSDSARVLRMSQKPYITPGVVRFQDLISRLKKITGRDLTEAEAQDAMDRWMEAIQSGDRRNVLALIEQTEDPTLLELYWELYYGGLLSAVPTQTVNALGTLMNITFNDTVVEGTATLLDAGIAGITGRQRTKSFAAVLNGFRASWGNWREAYQDAFVWWKSPLPRSIGGEGQLARPSALLSRGGRRAVSSQRVRLDIGAEAWATATAETMPGFLPQAQREQLASFIRAAAPFVGAATRGLAAMDVAAKTMAFDGEVARLATQEAIRRGLPAEEYDSFIAYVRANMLQFPEIEAEAQRVEDDRTFNDAPGKLGNTIIGLRSIPGLGFLFRLMLPFAGTPDRLLARGLELVPLVGLPVGLQEKGFGWNGFLPALDALKAGNSRALEIAAKQIVGAFLAGLVYTLWDDDKITGPLSKNPAERDSQLRRGLIPHALIMGDNAYEYRRFEPLALPMGAMTAAFEAMRELTAKRRREGQDTSRPVLLTEPLAVASAAVNNTLRFVLDSSYFSGLARFFESLSPSGGGVVQGLSGQIITAVVPFVSALRQSSRVLETTGFLEGTTAGMVQVRERETFGQNIRAGLPGVSAGVRPRLEVTGEPRALPLTPIEALVSPIRRAQRSQDPVEQELARLDYFPAQPSEGALRRAIGRQPTEDELFQYRQRRGQLAFQELGRLVPEDFFQQMDDEDKRQRIRQAFSRATKRARRDVFGTIRKVATGVED